MKKQPVLVFLAVLVAGIVYVAATEDFLAFGENSSAAHAVLYGAAAICATLVWLHKKD